MNEEIQKELDLIQENLKKGFASADEQAKAVAEMETLKAKIEALPESVSKDEFKKLQDLTEKQALDIEKFLTEQKAGNETANSREEAISKAISELHGKEEFKEWVKTVGSSTPAGNSPKVTVKYTNATSRTGNVTITSVSDFVQDADVNRKLHMRDIISSMPTDLPFHTFDRVSSWSNSMDVNSENGSLAAVDMTTSEKTVEVKRIGGAMDISKRSLKSVSWLQRHVMNKLPNFARNIEDFQILYGDGVGENLDGLYKNATTFDLTGPSFVATAIASVATYNAGAQALVTFAAAHGLNNGQIITFASATEATYNAAFSVNVKNSTSIVIDVAYVAEADTSAWTATSKYGMYKGTDGATELDVLRAIRYFMKTSEYEITAHVINPQSMGTIRLLKDTTGQPLEGVEFVGGNLFIDGLPVIESNFVPTGKFFSLDGRNAVEILDFTALTMYFKDDVTYAKTNKVAAIVEEEILLPIYNPFLVIYGDFTTAKAALETA